MILKRLSSSKSRNPTPYFELSHAGLLSDHQVAWISLGLCEAPRSPGVPTPRSHASLWLPNPGHNTFKKLSPFCSFGAWGRVTAKNNLGGGVDLCFVVGPDGTHLSEASGRFASSPRRGAGGEPSCRLGEEHQFHPDLGHRLEDIQVGCCFQHGHVYCKARVLGYGTWSVCVLHAPGSLVPGGRRKRWHTKDVSTGNAGDDGWCRERLLSHASAWRAAAEQISTGHAVPERCGPSLL